MNINNYTIIFYNQFGNRLYTFNAILELEFGRTKNDVGAASILLPNIDLYEITDFQLNCMLEIYRNGILIPVLWFLKKARITEEGIELVFFDHLTLLKQRYVTWYEVDGYDYPSHMRLPSDKIITEIIRTNMNTGVEDDLGYAPISIPTTLAAMEINKRQMPFTIIAPDETGPIVEDSFAWKTVLEAVQGIAKTAEGLGTKTWFDFIYTPNSDGKTIGKLSFKVWNNTRGIDLRIGKTANPIVFSPDLGTLINYELVIDYENYYNQVYITAKELPEVDDGINLVRVVAYPEEYNKEGFGLYEKVEAVSDDEINTDVMLAKARALYQSGAPIYKLTGDIVQIDTVQFFIDYNYGDLVSAYWKNVSFETDILSYNVTVDEDEQIRIPFDVNTLTV